MIGRDLKALYSPPAAPPGEAVLEIVGRAHRRLSRTQRSSLARAARRDPRPGRAGRRRPHRARARRLRHRPAARRRDPARRRSRSRSPRRATRSPGASTWCPRTASAPGCCSTCRSRENISLPDLPAYARVGLVSGARRDRESPKRSAARLGIRAPGVDTPVGTLSGGNQQKVVLAKWLSMQPRVMIFDEPTRGIDVGAKSEIYELMRGLADARRRDPDDLQRHGGGDRRQRPHRGDARGRDQRLSRARASSASTTCCGSPSAARWTEADGDA